MECGSGATCAATLLGEDAGGRLASGSQQWDQPGLGEQGQSADARRRDDGIVGRTTTPYPADRPHPTKRASGWLNPAMG